MHMERVHTFSTQPSSLHTASSTQILPEESNQMSPLMTRSGLLVSTVVPLTQTVFPR